MPMISAQRDFLPRLSIRERQSGDVTILDLEGNLIVGEESDKLSSTARRLIGEGKRKLLLNLAGVNYVDSNGIGIIVSILVALGRAGGQLKLTSASPRVREVLGVTRLLTILDVYNDELTALNDYR